MYYKKQSEHLSNIVTHTKIFNEYIFLKNIKTMLLFKTKIIYPYCI